MKRLKLTYLILVAFVSSLTMISCGEKEIVEPNAITIDNQKSGKGGCTFTYEQGFQVGKDLGQSETYQKQNWNAYTQTIDGFPLCNDYVAGVNDGYMMYRIAPNYYVPGDDLDGDVIDDLDDLIEDWIDANDPTQ